MYDSDIEAKGDADLFKWYCKQAKYSQAPVSNHCKEDLIGSQNLLDKSGGLSDPKSLGIPICQ
jgi:hypothetical protein